MKRKFYSVWGALPSIALALTVVVNFLTGGNGAIGGGSPFM